MQTICVFVYSSATSHFDRLRARSKFLGRLYHDCGSESNSTNSLKNRAGRKTQTAVLPVAQNECAHDRLMLHWF